MRLRSAGTDAGMAATKVEGAVAVAVAAAQKPMSKRRRVGADEEEVVRSI